MPLPTRRSRPYNDEIDVPLRRRLRGRWPGYGTLFHASHANASDARRTCLHVVLPGVPGPPRTQASVAAVEHGLQLSPAAPPELAALLRPLEIRYDGDAAPIAATGAPDSQMREPAPTKRDGMPYLTTPAAYVTLQTIRSLWQYASSVILGGEAEPRGFLLVKWLRAVRSIGRE